MHEGRMKHYTEIAQLAADKGIISASDVEELGISRNYLYAMCREGLLERTARGLYVLADSDVSAHFGLAEISKRIPGAVISLISALNFHELTTQIPHEVWLSIPRDTWLPEIDYPPIQVTRVSEPAYSFGVEEHSIGGVSVKIYSPAKTVADCFKFRSKVGLDVAIEALRSAWDAQKITVDELAEAAQVDRVWKVIRPYMEATV
jgi:predicted transcriptional regulator of viral defense system